MRLKNSIVLWVLPAALIPLMLLGLAATTYLERRYLDSVDRDATASLGQVAAAVERRLLVERDIATGLAGVPVVERFRSDVLAPLARGITAQGAARLRGELDHYIETFQSVRVSLDTVRVLDRNGNVLVKVSGGRAAAADYHGMGDLAYVEQERDDEEFSAALQGLAVGQAGTLLMTDEVAAPDADRGLPVYSTAIPLSGPDDVVGYLTIDPPLGPLNRVLAVSPRSHAGRLVVAEFDPSITARDGLLLYDDDLESDLFTVRVNPRRLADEYPEIATAFDVASEGIVDDKDTSTRIYFQEFLPYPDRLTVWLLALRVDREALSAPFRNTRIGIVLAVLAAVILTLLFAGGIARRIARPMLNLTDGLAAFGDGQRGTRLHAEGPDEVRAAAHGFNRMADTLHAAEQARDQAMAAHYRSRRLASLGEMAGGVAHEISNPINTILSLTTLIERQLPRDAVDLRDDVSSIREECERAAGTIRAIMNFSHDVGGEWRRFSAAEWLRDTVELAQRESHIDDVTIGLDIVDECVIDGDRIVLQRALRNLIDNALQASPRDAQVDVRLASDEMTCIVEVSDRGPGLEDEQRERAFDPFFTTKAPGQGSGLGLSISQGIVQHHGGDIALDNRPGGGAVARMMLPRVGGGEADGMTEPRDGEGCS